MGEYRIESTEHDPELYKFIDGYRLFLEGKGPYPSGEHLTEEQMQEAAVTIGFYERGLHGENEILRNGIPSEQVS